MLSSYNKITSKDNMKKNIVLMVLFLLHTCVQADPFVTTFVNTSMININLELHFSDNSISKKGIAMSQSYQAVNFKDKVVTSVVFTSFDKDKNGNLYGQLEQKFVAPTVDVTYNLALQDVPAHTVVAGIGTDAFEMPASQTIICTIAPAQVKNDNDTNKDVKDIKLASDKSVASDSAKVRTDASTTTQSTATAVAPLLASAISVSKPVTITLSDSTPIVESVKK
jgi:hypothetical protein